MMDCAKTASRDETMELSQRPNARRLARLHETRLVFEHICFNVQYSMKVQK
jgi:hypothetical protein